MSNLCETTQTNVPGTTLVIETHVYEDGYVLATIVDEFGAELDSLDGQERAGQTRGLIEDYLLDQYINN